MCPPCSYAPEGTYTKSEKIQPEDTSSKYIIRYISRAVEPNAQECAFAHLIFRPQAKKMDVLPIHNFGLIINCAPNIE